MAAVSGLQTLFRDGEGNQALREEDSYRWRGRTSEFVPQDRSGVVLAFPIRASRGATLHLVDDEGVPVAVGGEATLEATGVTVPVGYDGEAFVKGLLARNRVIVRETSGVTCIADFDFQPQARILPSIGPLRCHVQDGR